MSKREEQQKEKRQGILEAGLNAFTSNGYSATRLDEVAEAAGVAKGTIYLYFSSKEALFEEVVRENLFPSMEESEILVSQYEGSASELLSLQLQNMYTTMNAGKTPEILALLIGEGGRFPQLSEFFFRELVSRGQKNMKLIIERGVASGEFRTTDVDKFHQVLVAPTIISAIWSVRFGAFSPIDIEAFTQTHLDLLLHGLLA